LSVGFTIPISDSKQHYQTRADFAYNLIANTDLTPLDPLDYSSHFPLSPA
jgi:hypothetical protein